MKQGPQILMCPETGIYVNTCYSWCRDFAIVLLWFSTRPGYFYTTYFLLTLTRILTVLSDTMCILIDAFMWFCRKWLHHSTYQSCRYFWVCWSWINMAARLNFCSEHRLHCHAVSVDRFKRRYVSSIGMSRLAWYLNNICNAWALSTIYSATNWPEEIFTH